MTSQPLGLTWETLDYKPHFSDFDWSAESCQQHAKEAYSHTGDEIVLPLQILLPDSKHIQSFYLVPK